MAKKMYHSDHQAKHHAKMHESHPLHTSRLQSHIQEHDYDETGLCKEIINKPMHVDGKGLTMLMAHPMQQNLMNKWKQMFVKLKVKPGKNL